MPKSTAKDPVVNAFIDSVIVHLKLKSDAALGRRIGVAAPVISRVRAGQLPLGPSMQIRLHEVTGWSVRQIKTSLGERVMAPCVEATEAGPGRQKTLFGDFAVRAKMSAKIPSSNVFFMRVTIDKKASS